MYFCNYVIFLINENIPIIISKSDSIMQFSLETVEDSSVTYSALSKIKA